MKRSKSAERNKKTPAPAAPGHRARAFTRFTKPELYIEDYRPITYERFKMVQFFALHLLATRKVK